MKIKVVKVTATEFELSDGRVFQHPILLNPIPTPKEFQKYYDKWLDILKAEDGTCNNTKSR